MRSIILVKMNSNFIFIIFLQIPRIISKGIKFTILFQIYFKSHNYIIVFCLQMTWECCYVDTFRFMKQTVWSIFFDMQEKTFSYDLLVLFSWRNRKIQIQEWK